MWFAYVKRTLITGGLLTLLAIVILVLLWRDRPDLDSIGWPRLEPASAGATDTVTATWLGVGTLLFDDGETQILIDGFISRPSLAQALLRLPVASDIPTINSTMNAYRMRRLAAIIPVHSHFDHAMDIGAIANRSSASVLGSESTAQIARGAGVPEDQIVVVSGTTSFEFGKFQVTLRPSSHVPIGWRGSVPLDGVIEEPLKPPQPITAWRMGGAFTVTLEHPQGTVLVQGSAGYDKYLLRDVSADVVFLSVAQLAWLGERYAELYWQHTVTATGSRRVFPIHFDDYTRPFGTVDLPPRMINNLGTIAEWFDAFRLRWDRDAELFMPQFGKPIAIFSQAGEET